MVLTPVSPIKSIVPATLALHSLAIELATQFQLTVVSHPTEDLFLSLTSNGLALCDQRHIYKPIYVDFVYGTLNYRRLHGGGRKQALGRAIGLKPGINPTVIDATAGLGKDAFILSWLGCQVQMIERCSAIAALLHNGLQRAIQDKEIGTWISQRLQLIHSDTRHWLSQLTEKPDVIYLDPMYPHRQKSALVKKEMRIFREIVGDDEDADELLHLALQQAKKRVVVKRPKTALPLIEKPTLQIQSENTRYDVYLIG